MWPFKSKKERAEEIAQLQSVVNGGYVAGISHDTARKRLEKLGVKPKASGGRDILTKFGT